MSHIQLLLAQSASEEFWAKEFFGLDQEQRFVLLLLALLGVIGIVIVIPSIIATVYSGLHRRRTEMELKQDMLDRGMTAEEIVEVIKAAPVEDAASRWVEGWQKKRNA